MYRAVVFDFDGTIIDTEKHLFDVINKHLVKHNEAPISVSYTHLTLPTNREV